MFSIISVYNNKKQLDECLLKSLKQQDVDYELILIDNNKNQFSSAAAALNYGASQINGYSKYVMFAHQDIVLPTATWLNDVEKELSELPNLAVAGFAGVTPEGKMIGNLKHGTKPEYWHKQGKINQATKAQTVDECLFIIPRNIFAKYKFDEKVCIGWDLYAADYCLQAGINNFNVYVLDEPIWHKSIGGAFVDNYLKIIFSLGWLSRQYYQTFAKILKKYRKKYNWIHTTCISFNTVSPFIWQRVYKIYGKIKKRLLSL